MKRCLDLALCHQPISCVFSLLYLVLFYVSDGKCLSENSYHLLRSCLVRQLLFPIFEISQQWHSSANSRNAHVGAYKHHGQPQPHSFTSIHRSISSMNRSFSWGLLLRPNPLCRPLWYLPGLWCSPDTLCALPSLDGSPQAHHTHSLTWVHTHISESFQSLTQGLGLLSRIWPGPLVFPPFGILTWQLDGLVIITGMYSNQK